VDADRQVFGHAAGVDRLHARLLQRQSKSEIKDSVRTTAAVGGFSV
jgi:hypothetical protein